jgi:hypothetical protein
LNSYHALYQKVGTSAQDEYEWNPQLRNVMPSAASNFRKFASFLENRLQTQHLIIKRVFSMNGIIMDEGEQYCSYRLPWCSFDERALPKRTEKEQNWLAPAARWEIAYHGTRLEGLFATICEGQVRKGPSRKLGKSGV